MTKQDLTDSSFLVLALLAEKETHGYDIQKLAHNRGFRFWTKLQRSSIYNGLLLLEKKGLIRAHVSAGEGPDRKVFQITSRGMERLKSEAIRHLATADHPRSEIDLGIYALPFLSKTEAKTAFQKSLSVLRSRKEFLEERLAWCRSRNLRLPALAFERPLLALGAEIEWLEKVALRYQQETASCEEWAHYIYREPPSNGRKTMSKNKRRKQA